MYWRFAISVMAVGVFLFPSVLVGQDFDCGKLKCRQMSSCAEASYKLEVCGHQKRDRDRDGIPCEKLCGKTRSVYEQRVRAQAGAYPLQQSGQRALSAVSEVSEQRVCGAKTRCKQMISCEEARFYLAKCGVATLDRDKDGVPCQTLCR